MSSPVQETAVSSAKPQSSPLRNDSPLPERKAAVSRQVSQAQNVPATPKELNQEDLDTEQRLVAHSSQAQLVQPDYTEDPSEEDKSKAAQEAAQKAAAALKGQAANSSPSPAQADKPNAIPEKFKGKSPEEIAASYTELESLTTKLAMRNAELEKASVKPAPAEAQPAAAVVPAASATVVPAVDAAAEAAKAAKAEDEGIVNWVRTNHKDILDNPTFSKMVDGIVSNSPAVDASGKKLSKTELYQVAVKTFREALGQVSAASKEETQKTLAEQQRMKDSATLPLGASAGKSGKVWRRSQIDHLIVHDPTAYARQFTEISAALQEGRVREDL